MASRPKTVVVWYRGIPYWLDLVRCRRALVDRQVQGDLDSMESLANAVEISRSTASRFFSGRATSLTITLKILKELRIEFIDVVTPVEDRGDPEGTTGARSVGPPAPGRPGASGVRPRTEGRA